MTKAAGLNTAMKL